jgi:hypothetical protein
VKRCCVMAHRKHRCFLLRSLKVETLLRDGTLKAPLLPRVNMNDMILTATWYIWWERSQATHDETVQAHARTAQAISTVALNYSRAKKSNGGITRRIWNKTEGGLREAQC